MNQNINYSKSHIWNSFLENIISGIEPYYTRPQFQWKPSKFFLIFTFPRNLQAKKTSEKDHSFYNTVSLKKPHLLHETQLTWHWNWYAPATQPKTFLTLQIFQHTYFCLLPEKTFALHHFLTPKSPHSSSTLIANVVIFLYISVRKFLFQKRSKVLSDGGGLGGGWITSLRWFAVWAS